MSMTSSVNGSDDSGGDGVEVVVFYWKRDRDRETQKDRYFNTDNWFNMANTVKVHRGGDVMVIVEKKKEKFLYFIFREKIIFLVPLFRVN